jgi:RimJ/RimL family protein N-acetyltransferase
MATTFEWGEGLPTIQGREVHLRPLADEDAPAMLSIFGDPEVMRFWSSPPLRDLAAAVRLIGEVRAGFEGRSLFQWGVSSREGVEAIGTCTLFNVDLAHRRAEVGFALRRDCWGQGLATDALGSLVEFSFETLALHRLEADVDPRNERSQRVLERQGFRREGYLRERWHHLGEVHDGIFLGLLRREWAGKGVAQPAVAGGPGPRLRSEPGR